MLLICALRAASVAKSNAATDAIPKKLISLNAAAIALADAKEPMASKELVEAMKMKGLWTSPGGKSSAVRL